MRFTHLIPLIPLALALPSPGPAPPRALFPRQAPSDGPSTGIANAIAALFSAFSGRVSNPSPPSSPSGGGSAPAGQTPPPPTPTPAVAPADVEYVSVAYSNCAGAAGSNVTDVQIGPCEGGSGAEGNPCVFTQGRNYTIIITYTSPLSIPVNQSRTGLASYDGDQRTAYSGQSFSACSYTQCPILQGVEKTYVYPFRTFALPNFQKLVFNATNGIAGESIMCARVPVAFQPAT